MRASLVDDKANDEDRPVSMLPGCELVEAVIEVLVSAMECRLCHIGSFGDDDEYGKLDLPKLDKHW